MTAYSYFFLFNRLCTVALVQMEWCSCYKIFIFYDDEASVDWKLH